MNSGAIYLDYNATTPLDQDVLDEMLPWMTGPASGTQRPPTPGEGELTQAVEEARETIAAFIGARSREIVFHLGRNRGRQCSAEGGI